MKTQTLDIIKKYSIAHYSHSLDPLHDITHIERVVDNALRITNALKLQERIDLNLLIACCYLHDIVITQQDNRNLLQRTKNHIMEPYLNKKYLPSILDEFSLSEEERAIIFRAIINHPHSIPYRRLNKKGDWYTKILQDADTWDYVSKKREELTLKRICSTLQTVVSCYLALIRKNISHFLNTSYG